MDFEAVIGLEIHAQISTKTKMFCRCDNDSFDKEPNINTCPVCMGFPGQLPVINERAVEKGIRAALALKCRINPDSKFDRKNYFYPDNPKGFQISQFDEPISNDGYVEVEVVDIDGAKRFVKVGIERLHLEDDAGKLMHVRDGSLVDFNRSGTPLMEIVSKPDLHSASEASAFAREVQKILRYVDSSDADMEKGMMRFDASVSIRPRGESVLYPRAEIKNLNSFRSLELAVEYEIKRQVLEWQEKNGPMQKAVTVGWDDSLGKTFFMREKEGSDDYRYFPEPDLPPLHVDEATLETFLKDIPELPREKRARYVSVLGLSEDDARILSDDLSMARYFEEVVSKTNDPKRAASFINTILMKHLNEELIKISEQKITAAMMAELLLLVSDGTISNNVAKGEVFEEMYATGASAGQIVAARGLVQVSDTAAIEVVAKNVIDANPKQVADIKAGNQKIVGFLIGQVMKEMKGQANPKIVDEIVRKLIV